MMSPFVVGLNLSIPPFKILFSSYLRFFEGRDLIGCDVDVLESVLY